MNAHLQPQLCDAAWDGHAVAVAALISHPDVIPHAHRSAALVHAAHRGKTGCVRLLLPVSDPNARIAEPLWRAARYRRAACVRLLAPVSDTVGWERWMWGEPSPLMRTLLQHLGKTPRRCLHRVFARACRVVAGWTEHLHRRGGHDAGRSHVAIVEVAHEYIVAQRMNHEPRLRVVRQVHERVKLAGFGSEQVARFEVTLLPGKRMTTKRTTATPTPKMERCCSQRRERWQ